LIRVGRDAKKTTAIATAYPIRSAAIVISKCLSTAYNNVPGIGEKL